MLLGLSYSGWQRETGTMREDLEQIKQRLPLLDYLRRRHWTARRAGSRQEFVGLCPLHQETRPSFYVNARKNLFYCHGCGRGGDLIRFVELSLDLSFRESLAHLERQPAPVAEADPLQQAALFYQSQLPRHREAQQYLWQRGLRQPGLIQQLGIGYAPGGNLRQHLTALGYSRELLWQSGLVNAQGRDAFSRRIVFPWRQQQRIVNFYGRSITPAAPPHRLLPRPRGGLFAWERISHFPSVILVEGLFDLAVLWQAGFPNTTCAVGTHLNQGQFAQLCQRRDRQVWVVFDCDANGAGQQAALALAQRLEIAGLLSRLVQLPPGHDPNSYFVAGATAADFAQRLEEARRP